MVKVKREDIVKGVFGHHYQKGGYDPFYVKYVFDDRFTISTQSGYERTFMFNELNNKELKVLSRNGKVVKARRNIFGFLTHKPKRG